jgi:hypothetical protein
LPRFQAVNGILRDLTKPIIDGPDTDAVLAERQIRGQGEAPEMAGNGGFRSTVIAGQGRCSVIP